MLKRSYLFDVVVIFASSAVLLQIPDLEKPWRSFLVSVIVLIVKYEETE